MTSRNCDACSQHRNHPKWRRKAQTEYSSATPNGVFERHSDGNASVDPSEALMSGADWSCSKSEFFGDVTCDGKAPPLNASDTL